MRNNVRYYKLNSRNLNGGIILIALVITIIVLLILAGVTIGTLIGDNGLLGKTGEAKKVTELSREKELIEVEYINALAQNIIDNLEAIQITLLMLEEQ